MPKSVDRWIDNIKALKSQVNPRVHAANIRLGYDGWACKRRCGIGGSKCYLCGKGEDATQHIVQCEVVDSLLREYNARVEGLSLARNALLLLSRHVHAGVRIRIAVIMHSIYDHLNNRRHGMRGVADIKKVIGEHIRNGCEGSPASVRAFSGQWR